MRTQTNRKAKTTGSMLEDTIARTATNSPLLKGGSIYNLMISITIHSLKLAVACLHDDIYNANRERRLRNSSPLHISLLIRRTHLTRRGAARCFACPDFCQSPCALLIDDDTHSEQ